jgi:radical SAM-linked protein
MPAGPPPDPAVQRLRLRYAKRGRLRFSSHRDFQRALERALRRAEVPMAYSAGFSPHPRVSYANAAPTGAASEAEYVELAVSRRCDPERVRAALDEALPRGLDVLEVVEARSGVLADRLQASLWQVELPGVAPEQARAAVDAFLAVSRVEVQRMTRNGVRTFDARQAVLRAQVLGVALRAQEIDLALRAQEVDRALQFGATRADEGEEHDGGAWRPPLEHPLEGVAPGSSGRCAILHLVVRHTTPAVRPDDVLAALRSQADLAPPSPPRMTRLAQGPLDEESGSVADPLTADRDAAGA